MLAYGFLALANASDSAQLRTACAAVPAFGPVPRFLFYRAAELAAAKLGRSGEIGEGF